MRIFYFLILMMLFSCSSGTQQQQDEGKKDTAVMKEDFQAGQVIPDIPYHNDPSLSFALYLPSGYAPGKKYPVLIALDAHGEGDLPLKLYSELADQYGYILVGSNSSRNGLSWESSRDIIGKLLQEVRSRLQVNEQRLYLLGFSGGARVANAYAIADGSIAGVICCGAAAPAANGANPREGYFWLGVGGDKDLNYMEMRKYDLIDLAGYRIKHYMITFDGKHAWPPKEVMDEAIWWVELQQMRKDPKHKNDALIAKRFAPLKQEFDELRKKDRSVPLYYLTRKGINYYENLADLNSFYETWNKLKNDPEVDKALKREEALWRKEDELRQFYMNAVKDKNIEWWRKDVSALNQKIRARTVPDEALMYQRVLEYLSLVFYMQSNGMLVEKNIQGAEYFLTLYVLVDPDNKEAHYMSAELNALKGNTEEALKFLNKSIALGFDDKERLGSDPYFESIKTSAEFQEIVMKLNTR